jgi:3-methyladenine DNA glycosylase/8-oxoguanine DNA glycosylase
MPTFTLPTPPDFKFWPTVTSHGWCILPPFHEDSDNHALERVQQLSNGRIVHLRIVEGADGLHVTVGGLDTLTPDQQHEIAGVLSRCLQMDSNLGSLYAALRDYPQYHWIEQIGAGRMLAAPTLFEDLSKTLMTTNTTWNMTKQMVGRMADLGDVSPEGLRAFPTPQRIAAMSLDMLSEQVRAGYRNAYLHELATAIAEGRLDVESWRDAGLTSDELYKRITSLKGFGPYAAGSMLKLLGHYDRLATDTECRAVYKTRYNNGVVATDKEIAAYYQPFGAWRGLVQWMDVMKESLLSET